MTPLPSTTDSLRADLKAGWAAARMAADKFDQIKETLVHKTEKRDAEELLDIEAGCQYHQALIVVEARSACESAYENFRYDDSFPADVLAAYKLISDTAIDV